MREVLKGEVYNMENCGVTTARRGDGELSWKEIGQKFFEGRQVWK